MTDCLNCHYDDMDDLHYCEGHRPFIQCPQCRREYVIEFESDYHAMLEDGDTLCIPCAIDNRIKELKKNATYE